MTRSMPVAIEIARQAHIMLATRVGFADSEHT